MYVRMCRKWSTVKYFIMFGINMKYVLNEYVYGRVWNWVICNVAYLSLCVSVCKCSKQFDVAITVEALCYMRNQKALNYD